MLRRPEEMAEEDKLAVGNVNLGKWFAFHAHAFTKAFGHIGEVVVQPALGTGFRPDDTLIQQMVAVLGLGQGVASQPGQGILGMVELESGQAIPYVHVGGMEEGTPGVPESEHPLDERAVGEPGAGPSPTVAGRQAVAQGFLPWGVFAVALDETVVEHPVSQAPVFVHREVGGHEVVVDTLPVCGPASTVQAVEEPADAVAIALHARGEVVQWQVTGRDQEYVVQFATLAGHPALHHCKLKFVSLF